MDRYRNRREKKYGYTDKEIEEEGCFECIESQQYFENEDNSNEIALFCKHINGRVNKNKTCSKLSTYNTLCGGVTV